MQITVVYRSPSVSQATLINLLTRLLTRIIACAIPRLILGDFNEDILHCHTSAMMGLMLSFSFKQLVQYPTTPQSTLLAMCTTQIHLAVLYISLFKIRTTLIMAQCIATFCGKLSTYTAKHV